MTSRADSGIARLIISAPFGNYIQPAGATHTLGTFTALKRPGRWWRVIRTVRWYPRLGAWVNQIGLRNPGIDDLVARASSGRANVGNAIVSVHGFDDAEWRTLLEKAAPLKPLAVELNMSCPNIGHINWPAWLFDEAARIQSSAPDAPAVIVKLPPVNYREMFDRALASGLRWFHCCNTIPIPRGGVSGKPLKPIAISCIADIVSRTPPDLRDSLRIIGGGGITSPSDIDDYASVGATRFAVGTKVFNPKYLWSHTSLTPLIDRASQARPMDSAAR